MRILIVLCMLILPKCLIAQQDKALEFTLLEAIQYAVINNPQLKSTQLEEKNNLLKIKEVKASALPQLDASGTATDNYHIATQILPGEILGQPGTIVPVKFGTRFIYGGAVQLSQAIYNPSLSIGIRAAQQSQGLYQLQTFKSTEDLIYNVVNLFMQVQMIEKQRELLSGNIGRSEKLLEITNAQFKEGIAKKVDVEQLKVNFTNLRTQLSNTNNSRNQLLNNLKILMNIQVSQPIVLKNVDDTSSNNPANIPISQDLMLDANTDLGILDKQIQLQLLNTKNIKAGYLPTLSLSANFARQWQSNKLFDNDKTVAFNAGYYAFRLSIPIFDGFAKKYRIAQSETALRQIQYNKEYATNNIRNQFQTASDNMQQNQIVLVSQQENMKVAEDLYNVANLSYTEGITGLSELINAENGLREAQSQYLTAMLQMNLDKLELMKTSGQLSQLIRTSPIK